MPEQNPLDEILLLETSRRNTDFIAEIIFQKPELFDELFGVYSANLEPQSRRAAWAIDLASEINPDLISPYLDKIIDLLPTFGHDALKRHSMRILSRSPLPSDHRLGDLINISFEWLLSLQEAIAVKVYCMEVLYMISRFEPDLKKELADSIEWRLNEESAGFKSRGRKILKKLWFEIEDSAKSH